MTGKIGCIGNTIALGGGNRYFDFANPRPDSIKIGDIAKALSNTCRFGGHCQFYSVAEHSVHCVRVGVGLLSRRSSLDDLRFAFNLLMHDSAEAYIGDVPKPLKNMLPEYERIERLVNQAIESKFPMFNTADHRVKEIDLQMLKAEKIHLFGEHGRDWDGFSEIKDVDVDFWCWDPRAAKTIFLRTFALITEYSDKYQW